MEINISQAVKSYLIINTKYIFKLRSKMKEIYLLSQFLFKIIKKKTNVEKILKIKKKSELSKENEVPIGTKPCFVMFVSFFAGIIPSPYFHFLL